MKNFNLNFFKRSVLFTLFIIPLEKSPQWHEFSFNKIPKNSVEFKNNEIRINVKKSASPLIFNFQDAKNISQFELSAEIKGLPPQIPNSKTQGQKAYDDFTLRIGFIIKGDHRLNWFQRQMAPQWLIQMEKLIPKDHGIKEVQFFGTCQQEALLNKTRNHYLDATLKETCILKIKDEKSIILKKTFAKPLESLGLWISSDGDDTGAEFEIHISKLELSL